MRDVKAPQPPHPGRTRGRLLLLRLTLAVVPAGLLLLGLEIALRLAGFSAPLHPIVISGQEGPATADASGFIPDPDLRYTFEPGGTFRGRPVNRHGFLGRAAEPRPPANILRVLCMGDSCTAQGLPPYSDLLHEKLQKHPPADAPWEAFNMAVHGYSTEQALRLFRKTGRQFAPDFVTLFYGWNDHWRSSQTDRMGLPRAAGRLRAAVFRQVHRSRLYQLAVSLARPPPERDGDDFVLRVPHDEYRANLQTLVREIREAGAVPVLITAPRADKLTPLLVKNRQVAKAEDAVRLHDEYCDITREVAVASGAPLLDLERTFREEKAHHLFSADGIHFTDEGRQRIAEEIHAMLRKISPERLDA